jgi:formate dehydrogenase subunit gamma
MASNDQTIVRYVFRERLIHTVTAVTYVYLLLTGLAFWSPRFYWLATIMGGGLLSRWFHPWIGLVFAVTVFRMYAMWRKDMRITAQDRAWRQAMAHYARNEDDHVPPAGRFNYGQKMLFWVMTVGTVALLFSGIVLWFVDSVPWGLRVLRFAAILTHAVAALVTIGGFIVHLYMGLMVVPGGLSAILHGRVSADWAKAHHPLWHDEVRSGARSASSHSTRIPE